MASKGFLDVRQTVGYNPAEDTLVVTLTSKMANAMRKAGWDIGFDKDIGHFVNIKQEVTSEEVPDHHQDATPTDAPGVD